MDKGREELIQSIESELPTHPSAGNDGWGVMASYAEVADFIIARDRRMMQRVVEPLEWLKEQYKFTDTDNSPLWHRVNQAISICKEYL